MMFNSRERHGSSFTAARIGLGSAALGAALVYWLDPQSGARRRAEVRQKLAHFAIQASDAVRGGALDLAYRSRGLVAELRGFLADASARIRGETVDDRVLTERVRAELGHLISHPGTIEVRAHDGRIELQGTILSTEAPGVLRGLAKVRGVREIEADFDVLESADGIPELQGPTAH